MARQVQPPSSGNPSLPAIASGATQFSADAIPQAAFLDRVAERRHVRQSLQDEARCAAAITPIERGIDLAQKSGKTVTQLDKVIELGIAARNRRRIAANLGGKRRPDAGEPALKLARENVDSIRVDRAGRCRMRHDHVGWMAGAAKQSSARLLADMMHGFDRKLKSEYPRRRERMGCTARAVPLRAGDFLDVDDAHCSLGRRLLERVYDRADDLGERNETETPCAFAPGRHQPGNGIERH